MKVGGMGNIRNIRESVRDFKKSGDQLKWTHSNVTFCGYNVFGCCLIINAFSLLSIRSKKECFNHSSTKNEVFH